MPVLSNESSRETRRVDNRENTDQADGMQQPFDFRDKAALVTGAASGIGAACAHWLAAHGIAELVLVDLDAPGLDRLELPCETRRFAGDVAIPRSGRQSRSNYTGSITQFSMRASPTRHR